MSDKKKNHSNHNSKSKVDKTEDDDCQDCRKQRQQNLRLISMYERLKLLQNKVQKLQSNMEEHKQQNQKNDLTISKINSQLNQVNHKQKQIQNYHESIGVKLASEIIQKAIKLQFQQQNKRLKQAISALRQQNTKKKVRQLQKYQIQPLKLYNCNTNDKEFQNSESNTDRINKFQQSSTRETSDIISRGSKFTGIQNKRQTSEPKKTQKSWIHESSLWLFDNEEHQKLEHQLYDVNHIKNNNSKMLTGRNNNFIKKNSLTPRYTNNQLGSITLKGGKKENESFLPSIKKKQQLIGIF